MDDQDDLEWIRELSGNALWDAICSPNTAVRCEAIHSPWITDAQLEWLASPTQPNDVRYELAYEGFPQLERILAADPDPVVRFTCWTTAVTEVREMLDQDPGVRRLRAVFGG